MPPATAPGQAGQELQGKTLSQPSASSRQQDVRRQAIERIRQAVWQMRAAEDIHTVLQVMQAELRQVGIAYQALGVNVIDPDTEEVTARYLARSLPGTEERWIFRDEHDAGIRGGAMVDFWKGRKVVYRPDLHVEDPYGERAWADPHPGRPARCVLDVPFSHGTLALNSPLPDAFSAEDIQAFQEIAGVLSQGFRRLDDLQALEQRAQEAEALSAAIAVVAGASELEEVFQTVVQEAARLTRAERARLFLYDEREKTLVPRAQVGHNWEMYRQIRLRPGEDRSGQVFLSGEPILYSYSLSMAEPTLRPENRNLLLASAEDIPGSGAVVPLKIRDRVVGTLSVRSQRYRCTQRDLVLLERLAAQASLAIERTQVTQTLKENAQRLELLVDLAKSISSTLDPDILLQRTFQQLAGILPALDVAILYLWDPREKALIPRAWLGADDEAIAQIRLLPGESTSGKVFQSDRASLTRTPEEAAAFRGQVRPENERLMALVQSKAPILSNICVPLRTPAKGIIGTLAVSNSQRAFGESDLTLVEGLASQIAQAIANAQLFAQAQEFSRCLVQSQEKERRRVARELHDGLGQTLAAIRFQVQKAARLFAHDPAGADLSEIGRHLQEAIQETRDLSHDLRPSVLDDLGLAAALRALCRGFGERTDLRVELEADEERERLPAEVETALYRIAQEGLHNIERHARARGAQLRLQRLPGEVILEIRDEGQGLDEGQVSAGMGLTNMRERAVLIGGQLEVESAPGRGLLLRARVPLVPAAPAG